MKRLICFLCAALIFSLPLSFPAFAEGDGFFGTSENFDRRNVLTDLSNSHIGGDIFTPDMFPYSPGSVDKTEFDRDKPKLEIITLYEYGYSNYSSAHPRASDYGLYLYIYNPGNAAIKTNDARASVTLSICGSDYSKYHLTYLSKNGDGNVHDSLYIKYKVDITSKQLRDLLDGELRSYSVSEFELVLNNELYSYSVGGNYSYTGRMSGYGSETSTLACDVNEFVVVELEVQPVTYRWDELQYSKKKQLDSVYFCIPNYILRDYGDLAGVRFEYYEYDSGAMVGFYDQSDYDDYKSFELIHATENIDPLYVSESVMGAATIHLWSYNNSSLTPYLIEDDILTYIFRLESGTDPDTLIDTDAVAHFSALWDLYNQGYAQAVFTGEKSDHYNLVYLDNRDPEDWYTIGEANSVLSWLLLGQDRIEYEDLAPIKALTAADLIGDIEENLKVDNHYGSEIRQCYNNAITKDETVHLLRFADSEYFSAEINGGFLSDSPGIVAKEKIYMDFDIISLTFAREGKDTIIPVAAESINIISDLQTSSSGIFLNGEKFLMNDVIKTVLIIAAVVLLLLLVVVFYPVIKLVISIIILPFKLLIRAVDRKR